MAIRPLIGHLGLNTTQENINQLYNYLTYQPSYHQLMNPPIRWICNITVWILYQILLTQPASQSLFLQRSWWFNFQTNLVLINTCLFRSLHKKNLLLIICSQVIKGSELDEIICTCCLSIDGADYWVIVNNIKRARYCLRVGTCVIYLKLKQAHMDSGSDELILSWLANKRKINEMFLQDTDPQTYDQFASFHTISLRGLNILSLCKLIHWNFAPDHYDYDKLCSVHIYGLLALLQNLPQLHKFFMDGYFIFKTTTISFHLWD